jgi:single-strand DNA-binding protein
MNKVLLIGNLTRDPELSETASGVSVCKFSIAVTRRYGGEERKTDFFNCVAWRGIGETIAQYVHKGNKLAVMGSIETRTYEDSKGVTRNAVEIVVSDIEFMAKGTSDSDAENRTDNAQNRTRNARLEEVYDEDGDIPF